MTTALGAKILELERADYSLNCTQSPVSSSKPQSKQHNKESNRKQYDDSCATDWISVESNTAYAEEEQKSSYMSKRRRYIYRDEEVISIPDIPQSSMEELPDFDDPSLFCQPCVYAFNSQRAYRIHLAKVHAIRPNMPHINVLETNPFNFCTMCRIRYINRESYKQHFLAYHK